MVVKSVGTGATGARLKKLRKKAGFKCSELANELGPMFNTEAIKAIEDGTAPLAAYMSYLEAAMPVIGSRNPEAALEYTREMMIARKVRIAFDRLRYE